MQRTSGILMHISSLPSPYGIGTLGEEAYRFADFLAAAGQSFWQILPPGQTGFGDSPYQSLSAFAGNPYFIDLDLLAKDGLLTKEDYAAIDWGDDPARVDYAKLYQNRFAVLRLAFLRGRDRDHAAVEAFRQQNSVWIDRYALFMALKDHFSSTEWAQWDDPGLRLCNREAVQEFRRENAREVDFYIYLQFLFFRQWDALKFYVNSLGIKMIGDVPIYVPLDSADVWSQPELFDLDPSRRPRFVAGVPPDCFCATGQLWGNPLYDWDAMKDDGYLWWQMRMDMAQRLFDVVRFDHFRGLSSYWRIPFGDETAEGGEWVDGPGKDFITMLKSRFPELPIIAEDLGFLTDDVHELLEYSGFPGMKVLQFAFDSREPCAYLPHLYPAHCVCYTGTHDNNTVAGWLSSGNPENLAYAAEYFGLNAEEGYSAGFIRGGMSSVSDLFIAQMQDYLGLGERARMNTPSTLGGRNWQFRALPHQINSKLAVRILEYASRYGRANTARPGNSRNESAARPGGDTCFFSGGIS